ncbi:MAG: AAA family ATPase, partial [Bacteroidota bacterium]
MYIENLQLKNFKRFSDLTIDLSGHRPPPKLVLLIGANGSGKTSVFDAFNCIVNVFYERINPTASDDNSYYAKDSSKGTAILTKFSDGKIYNLKNFESVNSTKQLSDNSFYGRSSMRIIPAIENTRFQESTINNNEDNPNRLIDFDRRFNTDVVKYISDVNRAVLEPTFEGKQADTVKIYQQFIAAFNTSLATIFGENESVAIRISRYQEATTSAPPQLIFKKGDALINYDLLSHGEKQVVITLLNFIVRQKKYTDTIYYIDEMDVHLNTAIQKALLKEIVEQWIPDGCQLWTASHALGFIEYANEAKHAAIVDFDNLDFDQPQVITPSEKNNFDVFEIAVDQQFLSKIFEGKKIIFAENKDTLLYNNLNIKDTIFFVGKDKRDVFYKSINA